MTGQVYDGEPVQAEDSLTSTVYKLLSTTPVGDVCTYEAISAVTGIPLGERERLQARTRDAAQRLLKRDNRAVVAVENEGYRIATADQHLPLAADQQSKAQRRLRKARDVLVHTRVEELSVEEQKDRNRAIVGVNYQLEQGRRVSMKAANWQKAVKALTKGK